MTKYKKVNTSETIALYLNKLLSAVGAFQPDFFSKTTTKLAALFVITG